MGGAVVGSTTGYSNSICGMLGKLPFSRGMRPGGVARASGGTCRSEVCKHGLALLHLLRRFLVGLLVALPLLGRVVLWWGRQ